MLNNGMDKKYYVYGLYEEGSELPFYIGKGSGRRVERYNLDDTKHGYMLLCKFQNLKNRHIKLERKILHDELSESESLKIEMDLIKQYGKRCDNTGILFNFTDGGNQPPSVELVRKIYGEEKYIQMQMRRKKTFYENHFVKNFENIARVQELLNEDFLIKEVADILGFDRNTISRWIKLYDLNYDNTKKKVLEIERLVSFRESNSIKVQKTAKKYLVLCPNGDEVWVSKLVNFCKDNQLDYRGLRNTFNKRKKNGSRCAYKGHSIITVIDPSV